MTPPLSNNTDLSSRLRAFAELARVSNLPTCVTNTLVGCALGSAATDFPWQNAAVIAAAVCLLYTFGVVLNDVLDADVDRTERPHRPIPSGRISPITAWLFAIACAAGGLSILYTLGVVPIVIGVALCAAIVLYDALHRSAHWPILLLGVCRGMIYLLAAMSVTQSGPSTLAHRTTWGLAIVVAGYIVALSQIARNETNEHRHPILSVIAVPVVPLLALLVISPSNLWWTASVGVVMVTWLAKGALLVYARPARPPRPPRPPQIPQAIRTWIAGICLIDAFFFTLLDRPALAMVATGAWAFTAWAQNRMSGT